MSKNNFIALPEQSRRNAFTEAATRKALPAVAVEKDWWITAVLHALFLLPYAEHLSFKGGTSLSKCYNLIERFSEDIDIAINREKPNFTKTNTRLRNDLRRATCKFVREEMQFDVKKQL
jgi:predicted nucleotidyltransferase component of viral defense system